MASKSKSKKVQLVVSNQKTPKVAIKPGMQLEVVTVSFIGPTLKKVRPTGARLCGGTSTCIALIDIAPADLEK